MQRALLLTHPPMLRWNQVRVWERVSGDGIATGPIGLKSDRVRVGLGLIRPVGCPLTTG